jgi:hypothetical protein
MGQPVVLPKFELSGDKPHWAIVAAWIVGGLLLLSIVGLGAVIVHHRNLVMQAHIARVEAVAKVKAEAEVKAAAVAAAVKAQREAELAAKMAARAVPATTVPATAGGVPAADASTPVAVKGAPNRPSHASRGKVAHGSKATKTPWPKASSSSKSEPRSSSKPDAIDELLRKMK